MVPHFVRSQGVYKGLWICAFHPNIHTNTSVHMDAHACAHAHARMHTHTHTRMHAHTHTSMFTCTHAHSRTCMHMHTHTLQTHTLLVACPHQVIVLLQYTYEMPKVAYDRFTSS